MTHRGRPIAGERAECPKCHRWIGYWPDKLDYHVAWLMRHRTRTGFCFGLPAGEWCDGRYYVG